MSLPDPTGGEAIIGVAVRDEHGTVHIGRQPARHHNLLRLLHDMGLHCPNPEDQGFALDDGSFVNRRQAWGIARENGQLRPRKPGGYNGPELYSEDLW